MRRKIFQKLKFNFRVRKCLLAFSSYKSFLKLSFETFRKCRRKKFSILFLLRSQEQGTPIISFHDMLFIQSLLQSFSRLRVSRYICIPLLFDYVERTGLLRTITKWIIRLYYIGRVCTYMWVENKIVVVRSSEASSETLLKKRFCPLFLSTWSIIPFLTSAEIYGRYIPTYLHEEARCLIQRQQFTHLKTSGPVQNCWRLEGSETHSVKFKLSVNGDI
jgi:hypothetical protein